MTKLTPLYILLLAIGTTACQRDAGTSTPDQAVPTTGPAAAAQEKVAPFTADQVSVALEPQGPGALNAATGKFEIPVKITNNGKVALSGATDPPVNVGVQIVAAKDGTGGLRDFMRTVLPEIKPGESKVVPVAIAVDPRVDGHQLKIELVQEQVAWFTAFGQPGINLGPYNVCEKSLCPVAAP